MLVIGFSTISDALAMERASKEAKLPGRLGPVPREVTAGCGYAWLAEDSDRDVLEVAMNTEGLSFEVVVTL